MAINFDKVIIIDSTTGHRLKVGFWGEHSKDPFWGFYCHDCDQQFFRRQSTIVESKVVADELAAEHFKHVSASGPA